ncbi:MAG: excinuclease ATPase subunit [Lysobacterales bacterium CG17_big_fil_post_rev_8_21_14_2_50_64_11]|nr:MAG: excinuclease ATPase subunit [Xanthomonadales bacterium CG17_big_fil_post_rev_8_21_14_2_50_64_11]PIX59868.1 MAG: excinuclease ATPase subunit [Xanthomonadales bacterium CG_4_10_14_3_um_filter_64_11]
MKMKVLAVFLMLFAMNPLDARNNTLYLPISDVVDGSYAHNQLDGSVRFYFADQPSPRVLDTMDEDFSNRKTNAFGKTDVEACKWAMLSALVALQESAKARGANAVIGVASYYKKKVYADRAKYECHAGALLAGVALKGTYAKVVDTK